MTHSARNGALIHYHEIALKGKNRGFFLKQLAANLRMASQDLDVGPLRRGLPDCGRRGHGRSSPFSMAEISNT